MKADINHYEKFKEFYENRLDANDKKLAHALPDQAAKFRKLVTFDRSRVEHFKRKLQRAQENLNKKKALDMKEEMDADRAKEKIEHAIEEDKGKLKDIRNKVKFDLQNMRAKQHQVQKKINGGADLDKLRVENQIKESKTANSKQNVASALKAQKNFLRQS